MTDDTLRHRERRHATNPTPENRAALQRERDRVLGEPEASTWFVGLSGKWYGLFRSKWEATDFAEGQEMVQYGAVIQRFDLYPSLNQGDDE